MPEMEKNQKDKSHVMLLKCQQSKNLLVEKRSRVFKEEGLVIRHSWLKEPQEELTSNQDFDFSQVFGLSGEKHKLIAGRTKTKLVKFLAKRNHLILFEREEWSTQVENAS